MVGDVVETGQRSGLPSGKNPPQVQRTEAAWKPGGSARTLPPSPSHRNTAPCPSESGAERWEDDCGDGVARFTAWSGHQRGRQLRQSSVDLKWLFLALVVIAILGLLVHWLGLR